MHPQFLMGQDFIQTCQRIKSRSNADDEVMRWFRCCKHARPWRLHLTPAVVSCSCCCLTSPSCKHWFYCLSNHCCKLLSDVCTGRNVSTCTSNISCCKGIQRASLRCLIQPNIPTNYIPIGRFCTLQFMSNAEGEVESKAVPIQEVFRDRI